MLQAALSWAHEQPDTGKSTGGAQSEQERAGSWSSGCEMSQRISRPCRQPLTSVQVPNPAHPCPLPPQAEFTVLYIPPGRYTLTDVLYIRRSRLVLRGAGRTKTTLYIPKSEARAGLQLGRVRRPR